MMFRHSLSAGGRTMLLSCIGLGLVAACANNPQTPPPVLDLQALQGHWESASEGDSEPITLTVTGDSLYFYARPDFQYDAVFTLAPGTDPPELHATILDTPRTVDSAGELVIAVYALDGDALDLAVIDKSDGRTPSFDQGIGRYQLQKVRAR